MSSLKTFMTRELNSWIRDILRIPRILNVATISSESCSKLGQYLKSSFCAILLDEPIRTENESNFANFYWLRTTLST